MDDTKKVILCGGKGDLFETAPPFRIPKDTTSKMPASKKTAKA